VKVWLAEHKAGATEVSSRGGAHLPLAGSGQNAAPTVLVFTRDCDFDELVTETFLRSATILSARTVSNAMQIVCQRGRELDLALIDLDYECRGMTLLSAVHTCYDRLPIVVTTSEDWEVTSILAYANGARTCLNKPLSPASFAGAIADVYARRYHLVAN
jgi:DNA-binding NtrC family response regulator